MSSSKSYRFLFAGGGTGGHLFPAVAVAQRIIEIMPDAKILFVGNKSKIEGKVIPHLGFEFRPIWIKGFARKFKLENFLFPLKLIVSLLQSLIICIRFKPNVAVGTGGYVAGPAIWASHIYGAKILLLEQNSYPGVTTKILQKYADEIHLSFDNSIKYFSNQSKCFVTGNPVRIDIKLIDRSKALEKLSLDVSKKTVAVIGGSLGAASINNVVAKSLNFFEENNIQLIWQCGANYYNEYNKFTSQSVKVTSFIEEMSLVYSGADLLITRAGATTIAEITSLGLAALLIPSPNVAANHQYYNAKTLADKDAAVLIEDKNLEREFTATVLSLINDAQRINLIRIKSKELGKPQAADIIAENVINLAEISEGKGNV